MKKYSKLFTLAIAVFFGLTTITSAKVMTLDEFAKEVKKVDPVANDVYVFGEYAFTNSYLLDTQDIMIASRTVPASDLEEGHIYKKNVKEDSVYQDMIAYKFKVVKEGGDFGTITGLTPVTNYVGEGKFDGSTIDIKYINYNYIALDAEYTVETDSTYQDYGFSGNLDSLKIENGYLTGIVKMATLSEGTFSADETTGYYFALDLKIKNYIEGKTTVKITGLKEKTFKSSDFTGTDKNKVGDETTLKFLLSLNPNKTKQFKIEVDLDGEDETLYGPTEYIIDLTSDKLVYQDYSEAALSLETNLPADELYGFEKSAKSNYSFSCTGNKTAKTCNITGEIVRVPISKKAGYKDNNYIITDGWFIPLTFDPKVDTSKVTVTGGSQNLTLTEAGDTATILLRVTKDDSTHKRTYTIDLDGDGDEYLPIKYTVDWSDLNFKIDTEEVVKTFIENLNTQVDDAGNVTKENPFYHAEYNGEGQASIRLYLDSFKTISDIQNTGITYGIYKELMTKGYSKIELKNSESLKTEFATNDTDNSSKLSYGPEGAITNKFNTLIGGMMTQNAGANIAGKSFDIIFTLESGLEKVGFDSYKVTFTVSYDSNKDIDNLAKELEKLSELYSSVKFDNSKINVVYANDKLSEISNDLTLAKEINKLLATQKYEKIVLNYDADTEFTYSDYASDLNNNSPLAQKIKTIIDKMISDGLSDKELTLKLVSNNENHIDETIVKDENGGVTNNPNSGVYTIKFTTTANTKTSVENAINAIDGQDFFTIVPVSNTEYNILINDETVLSSIKSTGMMDELAKILGTKLYSKLAIVDATSDEPVEITKVDLSNIKSDIRNDVKNAIINYLEKIIEGNNSKLKGIKINVILTLAPGVEDENALNGEFEYTFNLGVKKGVDAASENTTASKKLADEYFEKLDKSGKGTLTGDKYVLSYENFDEKDTNTFYMKIGEYTGTENPEELIINGISVKSNTRSSFSVGKNSFLEAPIWVIKEDKNLYVSIAYMNASVMPGTNTLIQVGGQNFDVKLFEEEANTKLTLDSVTPNSGKAKVVISSESNGEYNVDIKFTEYNIPFLFHIKSGDDEIKNDSNLRIYRLNLLNGTMGFTKTETDATYGLYLGWVEGGGNVLENGTSQTLKYKLAIPGKGVIILNITFQAVTSLD